jgi:2-dehydropantoate 2-reductase
VSKTKTTIVGAGAIGGLVAAALHKAGHDVSVLARSTTLAALRANGLRVVQADSDDEEHVPVHATGDAASLGTQDFVVIALKAQVLPGLAASLAPMIGPHTVIVAAMNGLPWWFLDGLEGPLLGQHIDAVDPGGVVSRSMPPSQAIGCVVHLSSATIAPGVIKRGRGNRLIVGAPSDALAARAASLAADLIRGGFEVESTESIRQAFWIKLWGNMNMNPISALTGSAADAILDDPMTHALVLRMMEEASAIGERLGLTTGMSAPERVAVTRKLGAFKTSMLQDLEASRPLELMPILGVFPELGRKLDVPTPFCDAILGLLRQRAANSGLS